MHLPHRVTISFLIAKIFLIALLCPQSMWSAITTNPQTQDESPLEMRDIIDMIKLRRFNKEEIIQLVSLRGVKSPLAMADEQNMRFAAGGRFSGRALDDLIESVHDNYLLRPIKKPITLRPGKPAQIESLGFRATYIKKIGDDHLIRIEPPGAGKEVELKTNQGCEHALKWGHREFTLRITEASLAEINAVLVSNIKSPTALEGASNLAKTPPQEIEIRIPDEDCLAIRMRLVIGNHIGPVNRPIDPYYISEPLAVGILRHYAKKHTPRTTIPPKAKDTDPITEIYYEDALDIATMLGFRLPSLEQWINAFHGEVVTLKSRADSELVEGEDRRLLAVQMASSESPANTHLSSRIFTREGNSTAPMKGFLRVVRPPRQIIIVKPKPRVP